MRGSGAAGISPNSLTPCAVCAAALMTLMLLVACGSSHSTPARSWPPIVVKCDSTALSQLERVYAKRSALGALLKAYEGQNRAMDAGRSIPGLTDQQAELEKTTFAVLTRCGRRMSAVVTGLDASNGSGGMLILPDYTPSAKATAVAMSAFVNYELRTNRSEFAPASEIRVDMADVAKQFVPAIFAAYPRLQYVELHAHQLGWIVATMGVTRHAAEVLGDSTELYVRASRGRHVQGLGYSAEVGVDDFKFEPNEALVKAGRI